MEQIDEIAAVPGIDVLFVGPSDLSFSLGLRGNMNHPKVSEAMAKVLSAAKRHQKIPGCLATSREEIKKAIDQGFLFIQGPTELNLMTAGAQNLFRSSGQGKRAMTRTVY